jgi:hypothetical protein
MNFLGYGGNNLPLIPTMTSDTTPSGVISSSGAISGYPLYQAFDNSDSTRCVLNQTSKAGSWLQYEFNTAVKALSARLVLSNAGNAVHSETWVVQGSNNGSTWDNISSPTTFTWSSTEDTLITQNIPLNGNAYSHYRIINTNMSATSYPGIWTFQLYGSLF